MMMPIMTFRRKTGRVRVRRRLLPFLGRYVVVVEEAVWRGRAQWPPRETPIPERAVRYWRDAEDRDAAFLCEKGLL